MFGYSFWPGRNHTFSRVRIMISVFSAKWEGWITKYIVQRYKVWSEWMATYQWWLGLKAADQSQFICFETRAEHSRNLRLYRMGALVSMLQTQVSILMSTKYICMFVKSVQSEVAIKDVNKLRERNNCTRSKPCKVFKTISTLSLCSSSNVIKRGDPAYYRKRSPVVVF